jgi:hypothetical protein
MNKVWLAMLLLPALLSAQNARQIVEEAQNRSQSKSQHYEGTLRVMDAKGKVTDKRWIYDRIGSHGNSKSIIKFTAPAEVKGMALLVVNHPNRASDQWLWTPAIARERRVALQDRSTRFFGTDFSFEDLEERDVDQFHYSLAGEEPVDSVAAWKIESRPIEGRSSQYTRSFVWIRKDNHAVARIENYNKDQLVRKLEYKDFERVAGIWTARTLEMHDLRRNSRTILKLEKLEYNVPMEEANFTIQALRRASS